MKDSEIIDLYLARNETAITATSEKYGNYCSSIAYNILHCKEDSEECVNETYLNTWNSIPPHKPNCFSVYIGKITRNLSLNRFKKYNTHKRGGGQTTLVLSELESCIPDKTDIEKNSDEALLVNALNEFLYSQSEQKRNIFIRRYWYIQSIKDIANAYKISESKVTSILYRMRGKLKIHLEKEGINI